MKKEFPEKEKFIPRDISWLMFNQRVLNEALDHDNPLLERLRFLAIFVNNLDEFYMVRVAALLNLKNSDINKPDHLGYYPQELLEQIGKQARELIKQLYEIYRGICANELARQNIRVENVSDLRKEQKRFIQEYFETSLYPVMTPLGVDPGHPFPVLPSRTMAFAVHIKRKANSFLAVIPIPKNIPRVVRIPSRKNEYIFVLIEDIIRENVHVFFKGYKINGFSLFRVIRDSELSAEEDFTPDLLKLIESEVKKRTLAKLVYLEVGEKCGEELLDMLCQGLNFAKEETVRIGGHLDLTCLFEMIRKVDKPELCYRGYVPRKLEFDNIFDKIKSGDFIIHVPYESFEPTVELVRAAARDEKVLAIKMTLYRTSKDSAIISALKEAAANKKQVTILLEIKARFDEENNIKWARELETAGCHVIYGIPGLKVHAKMTLIVREEEGAIQRYVHLSTGNYNEYTARVYSDIGYFTNNDDFAKDISDMFNVITGYSLPPAWKRIVSAPKDLREYIIALIDKEIRFHKKNKNGLIIAKMNSLEDPRVIEKLYEASSAGVKVRLIVRGICCLVPGVKDLSENIHVKSIVGRFLEHTRIFTFNNNASPRVFLSSADWMKRNFDRRIELLFEIHKEEIKSHLKEILELHWKDNAKSWELTQERAYKKIKAKDEPFNGQEYLIKRHGG